METVKNSFPVLLCFALVFMAVIIATNAKGYSGASAAYPPPEESFTPLPTQTSTDTPDPRTPTKTATATQTPTVTKTLLCGHGGRICTAMPEETRNAGYTETAILYETHFAGLTQTAQAKATKTPTITQTSVKKTYRVWIPTLFSEFTQFYSEAAIYCVTFTSQEVARRTAEQCQVNPVGVYVPELVTKEQFDELRERADELQNQVYRLKRLPEPVEGKPNF